MNKTIKAFLGSAEAIQKLLHPFAEVVLHDIAKDKIVAIFHPFSKRRVGDPSLLTEEDGILALENCIGPYQKTSWDGRKIKSVSSVIRDEKQKAVGMLCINLDVSQFEKMHLWIQAWLGNDRMQPQPESLFKDDWQEKIHVYIHRYLQEQHLSLDALTREEKKSLLVALQETGAFSAKNAAIYIAKILGVSRATVYNYLSEVESEK